MAKVKNEDEKTEQTVGATVDVNPEDVKLQASFEAEVEKLNAELEAARVRIAELEAQLEQAASPAVEAAEAQERYQQAVRRRQMPKWLPSNPNMAMRFGAAGITFNRILPL